jgi:hypothetical protein
MRKIVTVVAVGLIALTGCAASGGVKTTSDPLAGSASAPAASAPASPKSAVSTPAPASASVGSTITLKGNTDENIAVTLVKVVAIAKSSDSYMAPQAGNRYYAIQWRIKNVSTVAYSDSPSNGTKVADSADQQFESSFQDTKSGPSMPSGLKLAPGASALGFITYEVPTSSKIVKVQFSTDSGFGETGEWIIG